MTETIESVRKQCLKRQTELRRAMADGDRFDEAMSMFFTQHAMLHSATVSGTGIWSLADAVLDDVIGEQMRRIPQNCEHSVAWLIWHMARCEDVTMNLLVAGSPQVLSQDDWLERTGSPIRHTGNSMDEAGIAEFSAAVELEPLRAYRVAVGRRTREIVEQLGPEDLVRKVEPARLKRVTDEGAVIKEAKGIIKYWGKRTVAGLLLMPATRHNLVHLNQALKLKKRRR